MSSEKSPDHLKMQNKLESNDEESHFDKNGKNIHCDQNLNMGSDKSMIDGLSGLISSINLDETQRKLKKDNQDQCIKNAVTIPEWLKDCETPFLWHLQQERGLGPDLVIMRTLEKLDELLIEEPEFSLQRFVSLLKLVLEYYIVGDLDKCCEYMKIIDGCLEEEILRNDETYKKAQLSLGHVVSSTKAHVLAIMNKEEESKKIARCIIPVKIMANTDKAALSSMKARFFLYSGYENGEEVGVQCAQRALELEPENPEWEYLLAKMLRQQRREVPFSTEVPRDELKLLESAVKKDKNSKYLTYLAQVYRECSSQAFKQYRNHPNFHGELQSSIDLMAKRSLEYYKEALALNPDSPGVLRRVGYGIMNLPKKIADYDLAQQCLLKSLDITENQMTLHVLGTFYHRYGNDNRKALEYFERTAKVGSHAGLSDMIRVKYILDHDYDPTPDFELGLSWKMKKKYHTHLLTQLGGYLLFIKRDFFKALDYFKQVIQEDKDSPHMKSFKSYFLRMNEPIDLYKYVANEALLLVQKHDSSSTVEPETSDEEDTAANTKTNLGLVEDFLELISEDHPELMELTPDPELIPKLIQTSREIEASWNSRGKERSNYRGRGRGFSGNRGNRGANNYSSNRGANNYSSNRGANNSSANRGWQSNQDGNERRGRFSVANQRERGQDGGDDRRGGYQRGRGRNDNWRQRRRDEDQSNKTDSENWRKK